jgi:hypothetical protein
MSVGFSDKGKFPTFGIEYLGIKRNMKRMTAPSEMQFILGESIDLSLTFL